MPLELDDVSVRVVEVDVGAEAAPAAILHRPAQDLDVVGREVSDQLVGVDGIDREGEMVVAARRRLVVGNGAEVDDLRTRLDRDEGRLAGRVDVPADQLEAEDVVIETDGSLDVADV